MARQSLWAEKVAALIRSGNVAAATAQIKVAPSVRDLEQLRTQLVRTGELRQHRHLAEVIEAETAALAAPRLHRAPGGSR